MGNPYAEQSGCLAGHACSYGAEDTRNARAFTRVRHCAAHRANERHLLSLNYGTLYPALLKLEQEGSISSEWGVSENNRRAKFYKLTRAGRKQLERETRDWAQTTAILGRFFKPDEDLA
jgi:hypothetical protein